MKKMKKSSRNTILFVAALALIFAGAIGGSKAALTYFSNTYTSEIEMYDIGVSLLENGDIVASRDYKPKSDGEWIETQEPLLRHIPENGAKIHYGQPYKEELTVKNSGTIDEYVRVNVYKYWVDPAGKKVSDDAKTSGKMQPNQCSPELIDLNFTPGDDWIIDESVSTPERTVLYYNKLLKSGETVEQCFTDTLTVYIDKKMVNTVTQTSTDGTKTKYITTYDCNGFKFVVEAEVDAVQNHNAEDAAFSSWGREVSISDGHLSLK